MDEIRKPRQVLALHDQHIIRIARDRESLNNLFMAGKHLRKLARIIGAVGFEVHAHNRAQGNPHRLGIQARVVSRNDPLFLEPDTHAARFIEEHGPCAPSLEGPSKGYMFGFGNDFETEALPSALPQGMNSPQRVAYGLYDEYLSGTAFTKPHPERT